MATSRPATRRLDALLVERSLAPTRERAQALIAAGLVEVDGDLMDRSDRRLPPTAAIRIRGRDHPWAGRGGLKLDAALTSFEVSCEGRVALDAGASTGGFTDVLLARGAALVHAVDVGHGQLDPRLAGDARVRILDRTNLRTLRSLPGPRPSLVTLDLSFISLRLVLPVVARLAGGAEVVALVKPQFELGREAVGTGGIVRDPEGGERAARELTSWAASTLGAVPLSPPRPAAVRGTRGNQEWFIHLRLPAPPADPPAPEVP